MKLFSKIEELASSHGKVAPGSGLASGIVALVLSVLALLGVLAFRFPAYLTTPQLRQVYDVELLRKIMLGGMILAGTISVLNMIFGRVKWISFTSFLVLTLAELLGGPSVPVGDFPDHTPYLGIDWLILDLLGSALLFIFIEKLFGLKKEQPVFRPEWQNDFHHFAFNHLFVGIVFMTTNHAVNNGLAWAVNANVQHWIQGLPFLVELFLLLFVADFAQYWTHRAYHEIPVLWRLHSVHHSAKHMDWMAGSRQHFVELLITRVCVFAPVFLLGFSKASIDAYVIIVGFQAVFNHANVSVRLGPLSYIVVTPNFHHWHHAQDREAIDRNYAAHFAFIDHMFGTAVQADRKWPDQYGVVGDYMPLGFVKQQAFPFSKEASKHDPTPVKKGES